MGWITLTKNEKTGEADAVAFFVGPRDARGNELKLLTLSNRKPLTWARATLAMVYRSNPDYGWSMAVRVLAERINNGKRVVQDYGRNLGIAPTLGAAKGAVITELTNLGYLEQRTQRVIDDPPVRYEIDGEVASVNEIELLRTRNISSMVRQQRIDLAIEMGVKPRIEQKGGFILLPREPDKPQPVRNTVPAVDVSFYDESEPQTGFRTVNVAPLFRNWTKNELIWLGNECFRLAAPAVKGGTWLKLFNEMVGRKRGIEIYPQQVSDGYRQMSGTMLIASRPLERYYPAGALVYNGMGTFRLYNNAPEGSTTILIQSGEDPALRGLSVEDRAAAEERLKATRNNAMMPNEKEWWTSRARTYELDSTGAVASAQIPRPLPDKQVVKAQKLLLKLGKDAGLSAIGQVLKEWGEGGLPLPVDSPGAERDDVDARWLAAHPDDV